MSHTHHSYAEFEQLVENTWTDPKQHELAFLLAAMYLTAKSWVKQDPVVAAAMGGTHWRVYARAPLKHDAVFPLLLKTVDIMRVRFDDATSPSAPFAVKTRARQIRRAILVYEVDELVNWIDNCLAQVDQIGVHMTARALQEDEPAKKPSSGMWAVEAATSSAQYWQQAVKDSLNTFETDKSDVDPDTFLHFIPLAKQLVSYYEQNTALQTTQQLDTSSKIARRIVRVGAPTWIAAWNKYVYYGVAELADKKQVPAVFWSEYGCYEGLQDLKIEPLSVRSYADSKHEFAYTKTAHVGINLDYATALETA